MNVYIKIITDDIQTTEALKKATLKYNFITVVESEITDEVLNNYHHITAIDKSSKLYNRVINNHRNQSNHSLIIIANKDDTGIGDDIRRLRPSAVLFKPLETHYVHAAFEIAAATFSEKGDTFTWESIIRVIKYSPALIVLSEIDGRITFTNDAFRKTTGYSSSMSDHIYSSIIRHDEIKEPIESAINSRGNWSGEISMLTSSGEMITLLSSVSPVKNITGGILGYVTISENITARKNMELSLKEAKRLSDETSRAKTRFMAGISHEIRTPMNAIMGMVDLALMTDDHAEILDHLIDLKDGAARLLEITDDILDFSKLENGEITLENSVFDAGNIAAEIMMKHRQSAEEKGLALTYAMGDDTRGHFSGDKKRIAQVLNNLVENSIRFTESGTVKLEILSEGRIISGREKFRKIKFTVTDTGIGIPAEKQNLVFENFRQADETETRCHGGTGLGLAIVDRLVRLMNGHIEIKSGHGAGSTVSFTIPLKVAAQPAATQVEIMALPGMNTRNLKILIAEDNPVNSKIAETIFKKLGHHVETARNGEIALEILARNQFDAVFMDIEMPILDGIETTRRIRNGAAGEAKSGIPVIAMTAYATAEYEKECLETGMNYFLTKPINFILIPELLDRVCCGINADGSR